MTTTYVDSRFLAWINPRHPYTELFNCDKAYVNVTALKRRLATHPYPIVERLITDLEYAPNGCTLKLSTGAECSIDPERVATADFRVPMILAYVPCQIENDGTVFWAPDLVDGAHRIARGIMAGEESMPSVLLDLRASMAAVCPIGRFSGEISPRSYAMAGGHENLAWVPPAEALVNSSY